MKLTLNNIHLENYKSFSGSLHGRKNFDCKFGKKTRISGRNREGKTTIMDAYFDVLTGKMTDGSQPDKIRPHDNNGADIDRIDIIRELGLGIDGKPVTVTKKTSQKWRKPRGQAEEVFDGNVTSYSIDGFEQKQKQFQEWQDNIANADILLMCSNARPFLNTVQKSTTEARKILEKISGFSIEKFISDNPEYVHIEELTRGHTVEDTLKQLRKNLSAQKKVTETTKVQLAYEKTRDVSEDIEISDLELAIADLERQLKELDGKEEELDNASKAYDEKSAYIVSLKNKLADLTTKANEGLMKKKSELNSQLLGYKAERSKIESLYFENNLEMKHADMAIERHSKELKEARDKYSEISEKEFDSSRLEAIKAEAFDENSLICSECGQPYPEEMRNEIKNRWDINRQRKISEQEEEKARFYEKKNADLAKITEEGNKTAADLKEAKEIKQAAALKQNELKASVESIDLKIKETQDFLNSLPVSIDLSEDTEYRTLTDKIFTAESELKKFNVGFEARNELKLKRKALISEIADKKASIQRQLDNEADKEKKVIQLEATLKDEGQKCADIEKDIDLLMNFSIEKNKALGAVINPHFRHFQFTFLDYTIEGNPYETLRLMVEGTDYFSGLNGGDKRLVELDLCRGLQEINGLCMPIWLDEANTIDPERIPDDMEQQLILLERSNNKLEVEKL
jgi:hypothetical protein